MRTLFVIGHYFGRAPEGAPGIFSSQLDPLARIAAVNASLVSLHRHFGPRRHGPDPSRRVLEDETPERSLDIVVLQAPGLGLLDQVGLDPSVYQVEYFDGPPMMLCFEAQRVLRDRVGQYDYYGVMEDDMVVHDPLFLDKLQAFEAAFGPERLLQPTNYEMAESGTPAIVAADPILSSADLESFLRPGQPERLSLSWHGREQTFIRPTNPHARSYFLSDAQLRRWIAAPAFYDRDTSWVGPIESAMSLSIGRSFHLYRSGRPDPFFLSIQHWGTRYARTAAPLGVTYGDQPLLDIAHAALRRAAEAGPTAQEGDLLGRSAESFNGLVRERDAALFELGALKRSRSKLMNALMAVVLGKGARW